jgi:hypothetical protein
VQLYFGYEGDLDRYLPERDKLGRPVGETPTPRSKG